LAQKAAKIRETFGSLEGDLRVKNDTIVVTYSNAPYQQQYENLPDKLQPEGIEPTLPWLYGFKLDFNRYLRGLDGISRAALTVETFVRALGLKRTVRSLARGFDDHSRCRLLRFVLFRGQCSDQFSPERID
jgi:hypothetical protein